MEKTLYNQVGEVKGKEGKGQDSFSFQFIPQNENLKRTRGALFTLVTVSGESENKYEKAKTFYHSFQSSYYAKASGSIINGLSETLDQVEKEIVKKEEGNNLELSLVAAVFWGSVVYLAKIGQSAVFVARSGKLKKLEFSKVASGVLEDRDLVCLSSEGFASNVPVEELGEFLNKDKFEDILGGIDKKIADKEESTCVVIRLSVNAPDEEPENLTIGEVDEKGKTEFPQDKKEESENKPKEPEEGENLEELPVAKEPSPKVAALKDSAKKISEKVISGSQSIAAKILKPWKKATPGELVDHVAVRRTRSLQVVALVIVLLVVSITIGTISSGKSKTSSQINSLLTDAQNNLSEAQSIQTIDPVRAKMLVEKATKGAQDAGKLGSKDPKIKKIESDAANLLAEITRSYRIDQLTEVFSFSTLESTAKVSKLAILEGQIAATDNKNNNVYSVNIDTKEGKKIGGSLNAPDNIASYPSGFYVQTKDGVSKVDNSGKVSSVATNSGWGTIVGAATYQSNLYLLDKGKNEIWRYLSTSSGLSSARAYTSGDKPDLSSSVAIAIDDLVWAATQNGTVYKLAQGVKQDFAFSGMLDSLGQVTSFFTSSNTKNHYILDQGKGRVVISGKTGVYQAQYSHDKLHNATSLVINEDSKTAYFTDGEKLYSFKIR